MLRNRIGFGIWCVLVVLYYIATTSFLSSVFLLATVTVFLFAYVSVAKSKHSLNVEIIAPKQMHLNKKKSVKISLHNTSAYPIFFMKGTIVCENQDTKEIEQMDFKTSIKAYMKDEVLMKIRSENEGTIVVTVKDILIKDMIGIFAYRPEITATADIQIKQAIETEKEET